jgi:hypothetical protein
MWEIKIKHEGLHAYRTVRGATEAEAETKAAYKSMLGMRDGSDTLTSKLQGSNAWKKEIGQISSPTSTDVPKSTP